MDGSKKSVANAVVPVSVPASVQGSSQGSVQGPVQGSVQGSVPVRMSDKSWHVDVLCFNNCEEVNIRWRDPRSGRHWSHQPWIVEDPEAGLQFQGNRQSRPIGDSTYYALFPTSDGGYRAVRVGDTYRFKRIPRYRQLSIEEAEVEFIKREKVLNHFQIMATKRFRDSEEAATAAAAAAAAATTAAAAVTTDKKPAKRSKIDSKRPTKSGSDDKDTNADDDDNNISDDEDFLHNVAEDDRPETEVMDYISDSSDSDDGDLINVDEQGHDYERTENYFSSMFKVGSQLSDSDNEWRNRRRNREIQHKMLLDFSFIILKFPC